MTPTPIDKRSVLTRVEATRALSMLTERQRSLLLEHLRGRVMERSPKSGLAIVYDITHECNLRCQGCCVSAHYLLPGADSVARLTKPSTAEVTLVLKKIREYLDDRVNTAFFLNFGGGEIFLRPDIHELLETSAALFGPESVGFDTNGTVISKADLVRASENVSYVGVSVDGLRAYHDDWRGPSSLDGRGAFEATTRFLREALDSVASDKVEVTTVVTRRNLDQIPALMSMLRELGVRRYSIHRTMLVGRFSDPELVPTGLEYLQLFAAVLEANETLGMDVHLHHSLESIYANLFLGVDTYAGEKAGYPDRRSSLGIGPTGEVYFDPWCMVPPWTGLTGGSLLRDGFSLAEAIEARDGGMLALARAYCAREVRCLGCAQACSGGSRIAAASEYVARHVGRSRTRITENHLLTGLTQPDPACPLIWGGQL